MRTTTLKGRDILIHMTRKFILIIKAEHAQNSGDLKLIEILPSWVMVILKMVLLVVKQLAKLLFCFDQYEIREGNVEKINVLYNAATKGIRKAALLLVQKAYDSVVLVIVSELFEILPYKELIALLAVVLKLQSYLNMNILGKFCPFLFLLIRTKFTEGEQDSSVNASLRRRPPTARN